jgi:hypothetical protein
VIRLERKFLEIGHYPLVVEHFLKIKRVECEVTRLERKFLKVDHYPLVVDVSERDWGK